MSTELTHSIFGQRGTQIWSCLVRAHNSCSLQTLMAVSAGENYYPRLVLSIISCFFSFTMIFNILLVHKLRTQFYQLLCAYLALADIIQCSSLFLADKQSLSYQLCLIQEYILQGACLMKAFITVIICSITWSILDRMQPLKSGEFIVQIVFWTVLPIFCLVLSIYSQSAHFFCSSDSHATSTLNAVSYMVTFLLPICFCICLDTIYYINMRYKLLRLLQNTHTSSSSLLPQTLPSVTTSPSQRLSSPQTVHKAYQLKLLRMIRKLKYYPLIFSLGWSLEIFSTVHYLITGHADRLLDIFSAVGITSIGIGISLIYFSHQKVHPSLYLNVISVFTILFLRRKKFKDPLLSSSSRALIRHQEEQKEEGEEEGSFLTHDFSLQRPSGASGALSSHGAYYPNRSSNPSCHTNELFHPLSKGKESYEEREEEDALDEDDDLDVFLSTIYE
jgi:hypothetical protein